MDVRPAVGVGVPIDDNRLRDVVTYVATPELLDHLGVDPGAVEGLDILTVHSEPLRFISPASRIEPEDVTRRAHLDVSAYSSAPTTLVTPEAVQRHGWALGARRLARHRAAPLTGDQVREAREIAAAAGLTVEARRDDATTSLRVGAIGGRDRCWPWPWWP